MLWRAGPTEQNHASLSRKKSLTNLLLVLAADIEHGERTVDPPSLKASARQAQTRATEDYYLPNVLYEMDF
jgi:hypothetical protein